MYLCIWLKFLLDQRLLHTLSIFSVGYDVQDGAQCDAEGALPACSTVSGGMHHQPALHDCDRVSAGGVPYGPLQACTPGDRHSSKSKEGHRDGIGLLPGHDLSPCQEVCLLQV